MLWLAATTRLDGAYLRRFEAPSWSEMAAGAKICGAPGDEIDHISGDSSALSNLQLLCNACHNRKTTATFVRLAPESHPEAWARAQHLRRRAESVEPLQLCDSDTWAELQKQLISHRRANFGVGGARLF